MPTDLEGLSFTELIQLETTLAATLRRRFEKRLALCFTDVVGSTPYFARFGDVAGRTLQQRHFDLLAKVLPDQAGRVVDTAGDGAFTVFPGAEQAAAAASALFNLLSAQNATCAREHQLALRAGLHFGPVLTDGGPVSGDAVNVAARVAGAAQPGAIALTRALFLELGREHRLRCKGLGPVSLKGIADPVELLALEWRDRSLFPARIRIWETSEEIPLPPLDTIAFGRLRDHGGAIANDVVLVLPDREKAQQVSRWHFELRRLQSGFVLRSVTDQATEVDGVTVAKGGEVPVKPGTTVRISKVMTILFLADPEAQPAGDEAKATSVRTE